MYDNEIETKENKILTKDEIKPQHIRNHDFSDVITPLPFYLVAKPFLWGKGQSTRIYDWFSHTRPVHGNRVSYGFYSPGINGYGTSYFTPARKRWFFKVFIVISAEASDGVNGVCKVLRKDFVWMVTVRGI